MTNRKHTRLLKNLILSFLYWVLIFWCTISCEKEATYTKVNYDEFSSEVFKEAKTIRFFNNSSEIPDNLFPVIEIQPNTFDNMAVIRLNSKKIFVGNLPPEFTSISSNNYLWLFNSTEENLNNSVSITIPFDNPEDYLLLKNYKYLYELYQIESTKETDIFVNWVVVDDFEVDTINNFIKTNTQNLNCGYCILFKEINCYNNYILDIEGDINNIHQYVYNGYTNFKRETEIFKAFIYSNSYSQYFNISESQGIAYQINFTFKGSDIGSYNGNNIFVKYSNSLDLNQNWKKTFENTDDVTIAITKYGDIGKIIEGNINGTLESLEIPGNKISINMDFIFIRVR